MPRGVYLRTKPHWNKGKTPWNKGKTKYERLINLTLTMIYRRSPELPTLGELFTQLVQMGEFEGNRNDYKRFQRITLRHIDRRLLKEGRGNVNNNGGSRPKFQIGDKVRICREKKRMPLRLRDGIRVDSPRTITAIFKTDRKIFYYVGCNRMGNDLIDSYSFRAHELIPFVKGKLGRPKVKMVYNFSPRPETPILPTLDSHQALYA